MGGPGGTPKNPKKPPKTPPPLIKDRFFGFFDQNKSHELGLVPEKIDFFLVFSLINEKMGFLGVLGGTPQNPPKTGFLGGPGGVFPDFGGYPPKSPKIRK